MTNEDKIAKAQATEDYYWGNVTYGSAVSAEHVAKALEIIERCQRIGERVKAKMPAITPNPAVIPPGREEPEPERKRHWWQF